MEPGSPIITTSFPAERERVGELRRWARTVLPLLVLDDRQRGDVLYDVELVLSELGANAVLHGCGGDRPDANLAASLAYAPSVLRVSVTDPGGGKPEYRSASDEATCGRGLRLVMGVVSRFGVENLPEGGKEIWAEIELPPPARPEAAVIEQIGRRIGSLRSDIAVGNPRPRLADVELRRRPAGRAGPSSLPAHPSTPYPRTAP
ncbi:ATP-binding protein [Kitasatospora sp. NPDC092039]|uniref:ATP-binding protein n=1 Tax=Kitasatospora sp. NPDC092039 TaxID=3364086 RepID=UPI0037F1CC6D